MGNVTNCALSPCSLRPGQPLGSPPLVLALQRGWGSVARVLLANGASINVDSGLSPLWMSVKAGLVEITKHLLERGARATDVLDVRTRRLGPLGLRLLRAHRRRAAVTYPEPVARWRLTCDVCLWHVCSEWRHHHIDGTGHQRRRAVADAACCWGFRERKPGKCSPPPQSHLCFFYVWCV
jgi:hypothetical protein